MTFHKYKKIYIDLLYPFVVYSSTLGFLNGITRDNFSEKHSNVFFTNMIGYTSIGIITGVFYPITYPLFGYYVYTQK
jgi:hypothetical protein